MAKEIKKQEIYFIAKYIAEQIAWKSEDEKTEFPRLVIDSFKKIDSKWEEEIIEEIWESGFHFDFAVESVNIGKMIERYIYLMELKKEGFRTAVFILIFRKSEIFAPEHIIDRELSETFYEAIENGVEIYPMLLEYREDGNVYFVKKIGIMEKRF